MSPRCLVVLCGVAVGFLCGCAEKAPPVASQPPVTPSVPTPPAAVDAKPAVTETPAVVETSADDKPVKQATAKPPMDEPETKVADDPMPAEEPAEATGEKLPRKELLKRARSGVVLITPLDALGEKAGFGSGCVIGPGLILTNHHVVANAVTADVQPRGEGDERLGAAVKVSGYLVLDADNDLAVLKVEGLPENLQVLPVADPESIEQFDEVFAIGHPDGLKFTTSPGSVNGLLKTSDLPEQFSAMMRNKETEWIQTDAVIAGGSSGGPLLNEQGEIVGINTYRLTQRVALAVGAKHVRELVAKLDEDPAVSALPVPGSNVVVTKAVAELQRGYDREYQQFMTDLQQSRGNADQMQKLIRRNNPGPACLKLCRELVQKHPGQQEAADALRLSSAILGANDGRLAAGRQYLDELLRDAVKDPTLIPPSLLVIHALRGLPYSTDLDSYLRSVIDGDFEPRLQAAAGVVLATAMTASQTERIGSDAAELIQQIYERFGDEKFESSTVKETLQAFIDGQQLSIGSVAPEIEGEDDKGEAFKLSDYRGKVVVLDFWADWCPHCRNLYPHERELVERLKDKSFALVGVNGDEPDRAKRVIAAGTVTWRSFMDGSGGPIAEKYKIQGWPTIYVLDQEGRIRFEGVRGPELDSAIDSLLGEGSGEAQNEVIAAGAEWKYRTAGDDVDPAAWRNAEFDDANWSAAPGPFGFGPISATTSLEAGEPGQRPLTVLFRKTFDRPAGDLPAQLLMELRFADGVAVYLNGKEIYRDRLPAEADWKSPAISRSTQREIDGVSLLIESAELQPTQNCLAVELHLNSPHRAEAFLSVTLGPPPDLTSLADLSDSRKAELCNLLGQIGVSLPGSRELLEKWQSDDSAEVGIRAAVAAGMHDLPVTLEEPKDLEEQRSLVLAGFYLNQAAWDAVKRTDLNGDQYAVALRRAKAGAALFEKAPKEFQPRMQGIFNTLGISYYRNQQWEEAKKTLQDSFDKRGGTPFDAGFLSLALHQLGEADAAEERRKQFVELLETEDWKHDPEIQFVRSEVERVLKAKQQ